ncbi:MAG: hypothetical protein KCHDKBKB_00879 [Elusimicrobia bacterium]|nr:hypothetical protein [Elusimicrobiota bacterium]
MKNIQPNPLIQKFLILFLAMGLLAGSAEAGAGSTTADFLKIGTGARGAAMGESQSAVTDDVNAFYWNPAGLSRLRYQELSVMHYELAENVRYNQAAYARPLPNKGTFALGLNILDYGDISGYDDNGLATSQVKAQNMLLTGAWGKQLMEKSPLLGGVSVKYLSSELAGYKASGMMIDLGLLYPFEMGRLRGLSLAANLRNVGPDIKYDQNGSELPQTLVLGAGLVSLGGNLALSADYVSPKSDDAYFATGLEYTVFKLLKLRVGYNGLSEFVGTGLTYGMGLHFTNWNIDYAMVPFGDLGNSNRLSVGVRFGRAMQLKQADEQVENSFRRAERQLALGQGIQSYSTVSDLLLIAPWHKPSVELKAKIEKQFEEMSLSKNKAKMEADIADAFTNAKAAFDRDELVEAKKGFDTILRLQPDHVGSKVYLDRITNRYASLAHESFKQGMNLYAAGDYANAIKAFEKTLTINPAHSDASAQLEKTKQVMADTNRRQQELELLAGAGEAYKAGLAAYQKNNLEDALVKFEEVKAKVPEYEEVGRYLDLTKGTLAAVLFEEAQVNADNGQLAEAVVKLKRAVELNPADTRISPALQSAERDLSIKNAEESKNLYKQGLEAYLSGQTEKAEKLWKRALELDSSNEEALQALSKIEEQKKYANPDEGK